MSTFFPTDTTDIFYFKEQVQRLFGSAVLQFTTYSVMAVTETKYFLKSRFLCLSDPKVPPFAVALMIPM